MKQASDAPIVSVIIAAYNAERFISACVESILRQEYRDFEIVVIDDGSTDETGRILDAFAREDRRLIVEHRRNGGAAQARNVAFSRSRGRYIVIMDADDLMLPGKIGAQVQCLDRHPEVSVVYTDALYCDEQGVRLPGCSGSGLVPKPEGDIFPTIVSGNFITVHAAMVRRECIEDVGLHDENADLIGDWDLWTRIAAKYRFAHQQPPSVVYRVHGMMSATQHQRERQMRQRSATFERIRALPRFSTVPLKARAGHEYAYGRFLMLAGDRSRARARLRQALHLDPANPKIVMAWLLSLVGVRMFDIAAGALRSFRRLITRSCAPPLKDPF